ncbi:MAG: hypothetical protein ACWA5P_12785 [bacterium]
MSRYSEKLAQLKKEIVAIENARKKKRWKPYQKIMIDFINGLKKRAEFQISEKKIILYLGDEKKGFKHILLKHYHPNDLTALDIVNIYEIAKRGVKLGAEGVSNDNLDVYIFLKNDNNFRLVLKPQKSNSWVVTFYRKS